MQDKNHDKKEEAEERFRLISEVSVPQSGTGSISCHLHAFNQKSAEWRYCCHCSGIVSKVQYVGLFRGFLCVRMTV